MPLHYYSMLKPFLPSFEMENDVPGFAKMLAALPQFAFRTATGFRFRNPLASAVSLSVTPKARPKNRFLDPAVASTNPLAVVGLRRGIESKDFQLSESATS